MLLDRIIKETTDVSRIILPLDDWLDDTEVITEIVSVNTSLGTTGWGNTPFPPMAAPPPYDPTPLLIHSLTMEEDNRTMVVFVSFGTPGNVYTCTFVLAGTSARQFTFELGVQISGEPLQQVTVALPVTPTQGPYALALSGGTMTGPLYLYADPTYPTEAATKYYVDHVAGATGGPFLSLSGGIMTGTLMLAGDPVYPDDAATKSYVDNVVGSSGWVPIAGGTMTGPLVLSGDPVHPLDAVPKRYVDGLAVSYLALSGGTMTGMLTLRTDPTAPLQAATKQYVDAVAAGVSSFNGRNGAVTLTLADVTGVGGAPLAGPAFTGNPTAPTQIANTSNTTLATTAFVTNAVSTVTGAVVSFNARTGAVTLTASDLTGVGGALLAGPAFTGNPTATTQAVGTSNTTLATTAFVAAAFPNFASSTLPIMDGAAAIGTGTTWARADHRHPSDTALVAKSGGTMTGNLITPAINFSSNGTHTFAFGWTGSYLNLMVDGTNQGNYYTAGTADGRYLYKSGDTCTGSLTVNGNLIGGYVRSTGAIMCDSGTFYIGNNTNYYLARNSGDGAWRFVENGTVNGTIDTSGGVRSRGDLQSGANVLGGGLVAAGWNSWNDMFFGPGASGRMFQWSSQVYLDYDPQAQMSYVRFGNWIMSCRSDCILGDNTSYVAGNGAYSNWSDVRLKQDIEDAPYGLAHILRLRTHRFVRRQTEASRAAFTAKREVGFIADEVREVIPEAVTELDVPPSQFAHGEDKALALQSEMILAVAINAIQELTARVATLEGRSV